MDKEPEVIRVCAMCMSYIKTSYTVEYFTDCEQHNNSIGFIEEMPQFKGTREQLEKLTIR